MKILKTSNFIKLCEDNIKIRLLKTLDDGTKVFLVNGKNVRKIFIDFTMGGHSEVYPFLISKNEIWIEDMKDSEDIEDTLIHEIAEYKLMKYKKLPYEKAHELANIPEKKLRENNENNMCM